MIIVVDGIDRVGKTTLCNKLSEYLDFPIYKHDESCFDYSKMDNDNETDKMIQLIELAEVTNSDIIFDRFHLSDCAYGVLERRYDYTKALQNFSKIDAKLSEVGALVIYVYPENLQKSSSEHGKDLSMHFFLMNLLTAATHSEIKLCSYSEIDNVISELVIPYLGD